MRHLRLLLLLPLLLLATCSRAAPIQPRLVVLYGICSLNKDFLAPYDPAIPFTPNFNAFAKDAVVFDRHMTEAGQSGISFASLFSGIHAYSHGAYRHPIRIGDHLYQITEAFGDAGYDTHFWSGQRMGSVELNYGQGVPPANAYQVGPGDLDTYTANDERFAAILQRLKDDPDYKAFVLINLTMSHSPYHSYAKPAVIEQFCRRFPNEIGDVTPEMYDKYIRIYDELRLPLQWSFESTKEKLGLDDQGVKELAATLLLAYKACIWQLDGLVGKWLHSIEQAGLLPESMISITSDHGEVLYRENADFKWTHGLQLVPEDINVAWMLRSPMHGLVPHRYEGVTRSIDVYPTMAGLCGIRLPKDAPIEGLDLSAAVLGKEPEPDLIAFSHTTTLSEPLLETFENFHPAIDFNPTEDVRWVWVRAQQGDMEYKWRNTLDRGWVFQAFDLAVDRGETNDLFDPSNPEHQRMAALMRAYKDRLIAGYGTVEVSEDQPTEAEAIKELTGLGYLEGKLDESE